MLPWQQLKKCHSLPFVMHISGAKFEEHCYNISRDILDSVVTCFLQHHQVPHLHNIKT